MKPLSHGAAVALMVLTGLLWSSAGVTVRHIERAEAFEQVFWRSLFAFAFVAAFLTITGKGAGPAARAAGWPGMLSGSMWAVMYTAFLVALALTTTANTLVVMSVSPLITAVLARVVLSEPVTMRTWVAAACAMIGIGWMFGFSVEEPRHLAGMLVALLIPIAAAVNVVTLRASRARLDLIPAVMIGGALSSLIALPFALPFSATWRDIALLAFLGFFQLGLPCMLLVVVSRSLPAPEIALLALLEVVLGPLWAWLGAGETPTRATLIGGVLVLAALAANELAALGVRGQGRNYSGGAKLSE